MSEEKDKPYYENPGVMKYLDPLFDSLLEVRQSIRNKDPNEIAVPKLKGLLILLGRVVELEVAANVKV